MYSILPGQILIVEELGQHNIKTKYMVVSQDKSVPEILDVYCLEDNRQLKLFVYDLNHVVRKKEHTFRGVVFDIKYTLI
jgi:hypothetical protein